MTREQTVFILANEALSKVVGTIRGDQWGMKIPSWFKTGRTQGDVTLRTIVNYHAYDDAWVPDVLAGKTMKDVGSKYDGDLLGDGLGRSFAKYNAAACEAVRGLSDPDRLVHLSYGDYPAREYLVHTMSFRGFRVYDMAKLIGADTTMPEALVEGMWELLGPRADEFRKAGVWAPPTSAPANATLQEKMLTSAGMTL